MGVPTESVPTGKSALMKADDLAPFGRRNHSRIETSSRLRVWWLTKLADYRVKLVKSRPKAILGHVVEVRVWTLVREPGTTADR